MPPRDPNALRPLAAHHMEAPGQAGVSHYGLPAFLQEFLDSQGGTTLAIFLHASGVLLFVGGLGYAALHIFATGQRFTARHLRLTQWAVWGGLAANLLGGCMRLAQSDHPTLASLNSDPWVQILLTKHVLWAALVGVTAYLLHRVMPRLVAVEPQEVAVWAARKATLQSIGLVLLIAAAGASAVSLGPGTHGAEPTTDTGTTPEGEMLVNRTLQQSFNGTITGLPSRGASQEFPIQVPSNATRLSVSAAWSDATARLLVRLVDPAGSATPATVSGMRAKVEIPAPSAGTWHLVISTQQALQEPYTGTIQVEYVDHDPPGEPPHAH